MTAKAFPEALPHIRAAIDAGILKDGTWGNGTDAVCMMSAVVTGAENEGDCVATGWPAWLVRLNVSLFDAEVGANDEDKARQHFALGVAGAVAKPVNFDKAHDLFSIRRLETGEHSALKALDALKGDWSEQRAAILQVVDLLKRRIAGENVAEEMKAAARAARAAADAARAAARAAYAAARAAADAAYAAADAAYAAYAAARADLIAALTEAQEA